MLCCVKQRFITSVFQDMGLEGSVKPQLNVGHHNKYKEKQNRIAQQSCHWPNLLCGIFIFQELDLHRISIHNNQEAKNKI